MALGGFRPGGSADLPPVGEFAAPDDDSLYAPRELRGGTARASRRAENVEVLARALERAFPHKFDAGALRNALAGPYAEKAWRWFESSAYAGAVAAVMGSLRPPPLKRASNTTVESTTVEAKKEG